MHMAHPACSSAPVSERLQGLSRHSPKLCSDNCAVVCQSRLHFSTKYRVEGQGGNVLLARWGQDWVCLSLLCFPSPRIPHTHSIDSPRPRHSSLAGPASSSEGSLKHECWDSVSKPRGLDGLFPDLQSRGYCQGFSQ